ncbi:GPW/gp25 family protein [Brevibacillus aydinogluensis]|uniref:Baseplate protein n=1 Tax=Brevibacillus aydinogluensis TaxID=927786 RepID=A0AA48MAY1_9BACL|nr:GPW/gp25 family protein [Brevibacillus aydinogluensis]CAJ1003871.1 Baseplate protein [Brevibacillus aydinogluensis]
MEYEVTTKSKGIDFGATGVKEILQNVWMILSSPQFSCPLDRAFAWSAEDVDMPIPVAQARMTARLIDAIRRYEPRVEVVGVTYQPDHLGGRLNPVVKVRIADGTV